MRCVMTFVFSRAGPRNDEQWTGLMRYSFFLFFI